MTVIPLQRHYGRRGRRCLHRQRLGLQGEALIGNAPADNSRGEDVSLGARAFSIRRPESDGISTQDAAHFPVPEVIRFKSPEQRDTTAQRFADKPREPKVPMASSACSAAPPSNFDSAGRDHFSTPAFSYGGTGTEASQANRRSTRSARPNVVLILMDNPGYGGLGVYGGGILRGAGIPRIDQLANEGT